MSGILVSLLVVLYVLAVSSAQSVCSNGQRTFSIGEPECVLLTPYYSEYQWATCLTDTYVRRVNQDHYCRGGAAICWYQCQLELYGEDSGQVNPNCRCSIADPTRTPLPVIAPECSSPGYLQCNWYRQCLEVRYPCAGMDNGYAIEYALKFCNLYSDNYNDFTPSGRIWVDEVRNCLQRALIPTLRPWESYSCADIRNIAFSSHGNCYVNPTEGAHPISICSIPCIDTWKVFWIVNVVGGAIFTSPVDVGKQMIDVISGCSGILDCTPASIKTVILSVQELHSIATNVTLKVLKFGQSIAEFLNLGDNGIGWFPYFSDEDRERERRNVQSNGAGDNITLLLVDLQLLGISNSIPITGRRTLEETMLLLEMPLAVEL